MNNMVIKHCNRPDYVDKLWNPSSLEILEMLDRHFYLYLHNQTMEETEKSLPAFCSVNSCFRKREREKIPKKTLHHQNPQTSKKYPIKKIHKKTQNTTL